MTAHSRFPPATSRPVRRPNDADSRATAEFDLAWLGKRGTVMRDSRRLPDTPETDAAIATFARGTLLRGIRGPVAVEDLKPGDPVATRGGGTARIEWIGARDRHEGAKLFRVAPHAFGTNGPEAPVLLGPAAHVLIESARCRILVGGPLAFAPVAAFEDGHRVAAIQPPGGVTVYGLACVGQEALMVEGLAVETSHPARATARSLNRSVLTDMTRLFPHLSETSDFGTQRIPHLTASEARLLTLSGF